MKKMPNNIFIPLLLLWYVVTLHKTSNNQADISYSNAILCN